MQNMWQFQTGDLFKICLWNHLSNILNLWNKSKPNKELRGRALSFVNCKWRTGVKLIQTARADSVIKCVLYSTTQNLGCFPWCQFEQKKDNFTQETSHIFFPPSYFETSKSTTNYFQVGSLHSDSLYTVSAWPSVSLHFFPLLSTQWSCHCLLGEPVWPCGKALG